MSRQIIAVHFSFSVQYKSDSKQNKTFSSFLSSLAEWAQKFKKKLDWKKFLKIRIFPKYPFALDEMLLRKIKQLLKKV